jgi:hypothetical protein
VDELDTGLALFEGLLGGARVGQGTATDGTWHYVDLDWPGPLGLRLIAPTPEAPAQAETALAAWLGPLPGRLHHLVFALPSDGSGRSRSHEDHPAVPGLLETEGPVRVIEPADNLGTRLVLMLDDALESAPGSAVAGRGGPDPDLR